MKLYYAPGACSLSPHIVLEESGLPFELEKVDLQTKETASGHDFYLVNTKGSVPALELDDGQVLTEGAAIVQYLGDQVPEKELIPLPKTMERYRVMEWLNFIATELQKSFTPIFNPAYTSCREEAKKTLLRQFDFVDRRLTGKSYVMGERFTVVDAYLFTISTWIEAAELSVDQWKALSAYRKRISERPAVCRAMMAEGLV
ncbi:glutathione transferase GstA [Oxalobacter aliiformigenes]|uniref:Glutathione transferase GstA n=1 Tax=Oxalobacter aliiformigenes TaxID=2946593 RepID=A0A9E9LIK7_9BURK|nr:glutathione transferase GstA [Oxalobacter aliiformigenes]WAV91740.1 glutathione transferase GstA [Oxalobacter aliiformigenes]WAV93837.1 glutathione transferase GstA [Oxalobacter aliiformigenes]WAV94661.1 glutathione transferase GstA [Oxalobacter aliiformigenes]WAV97532.1 glutathione transferase GstA [Oxalobacter aliiformigenes]